MIRRMDTDQKLQVKLSKDIDGKINYYLLEKKHNSHRIICEIICSLGFGDEDILVFDVPFEGLSEEFFAVYSRRFRVDLMVTDTKLHLVIEIRDKSMSKSELNKLLSAHLELPRG